MQWQGLNDSFVTAVIAPADAQNKHYFVFADEQLLAAGDGQPFKPLSEDNLRWLGLEEKASHYLGTHHDKHCYALDIHNTPAPEGYQYINLWKLLGQVDDGLLDLAGRAKQVTDWYRNHQYCGKCGTATVQHAKDRAMACPACRAIFYPRIAPSIIVLVTKGEEILLARGHNMRGGFYSTLAGFVEAGESIEQAVHREVFEEVGIKIKNLEYFSSQPWPFPNSLMLGFHAEYDSGEFVLQEEEIADAQWFHIDNLPNKPAMFSISGWLIDHYIKRCKGG